MSRYSRRYAKWISARCCFLHLPNNDINDGATQVQGSEPTGIIVAFPLTPFQKSYDNPDAWISRVVPSLVIE
jgi:hypothetical protein